MDENDRRVLRQAFEQTEDNFRTHTASEDWADNIIKGSRGIKTVLQWRHYYTWLANPRGYEESSVGEPERDLSKHLIEPYPSFMEEVRYQNGNETIIHVKNKQFQGDEKVPD